MGPSGAAAGAAAGRDLVAPGQGDEARLHHDGERHPVFRLTDADGDQVALPCTERLYTERQAVQAASYKVMPLVSLRGRPEVRLAGFTSLAGTPLAGFWAPVQITPRTAEAPAPAPRPRRNLLHPHASRGTSRRNAGSPPEAEEGADLDSLPASLSPPEPEAPAEPAEAVDDLDALLASLNAPAPKRRKARPSRTWMRCWRR